MSAHKEGHFQASEIPDLQGYVAIVTGGNSGVGYETSLQLARRNARVYIAGRSQFRVNEAISEMRKSSPKAGNLDLRFLALDLNSLNSVTAAAREFMNRESRLDLLINNAGVSLPLSNTAFRLPQEIQASI